MTTSGSDEIVLPIRLDTEGAEQALSGFSASVRTGATEIRGSAESATFSLEEWIKSWRKHEKLESRNTKFLAYELSSLGLAAGETGRNFSHLAIILSGGFGVLSAVELVKWGVEKIVEQYKETQKENQQMAAATEEYSYLTRESLERIAVKAKEVAPRTGASFEQAFAKIAKDANDTAEIIETTVIKAVKKASDSYLLPDERNARDVREAAAKVLADYDKQIKESEDKRAALVKKGRDEEAALAWAATERIREERAERQKSFDARIEQADRLAELGRRAKAEEAQDPQNRHKWDKAEEYAKQSAEMRLQFQKEGASESLKVELEYSEKKLKIHKGDTATLVALENWRWNALAQIQFKHDKENEKLAAEAAKKGEEEDKKDLAEALKAMEHRADLANKFRLLSEAGWDKEKANKLEAAEKERDSEQEIVDNAHALGLMNEEAYRAQLLAIDERFAEARSKIFEKESYVEQALMTAGTQLYQRFAQSVGSAFGSMATHAGAYERALIATGKAHRTTAAEAEGAVLAQLQAVLGAAAQEAEVQAVMETAKGFAYLADMKYDSAAQAFTSAGIFATVGGVAAAAGYAVGEYRPMTADERNSAYGAPASSLDTAGARGAGSASSTGGVVKETVILIGDPFETPQETARRAARAVSLAKDLDLMRRVV